MQTEALAGETIRFDVLTIFPELLDSPLKEGIIRRAQEAGQIGVFCHNIREYALDKHAMTDDRPFGGGEGMVMKPEPLAAAPIVIVFPPKEYLSATVFSTRSVVMMASAKVKTPSGRRD